MLMQAPLQWTDLHRWPWFVYVWLAFMAAGFAKPLWKRLRQIQASSWSTTVGRIDRTGVKDKGLFSGSRNKFAAEIGYQYSVGGETFKGEYLQHFELEEQAGEFVRDLEGRVVTVSYDARKPGRSTLLKSAAQATQAQRAPAPESMAVPLPPPGWARPLIWPLIVLSACGLAASLWVHLGALAGRRVAPQSVFFLLHIGIFVVWFPAIFIAQKRVGTSRRRNFWSLILQGAPAWMRYMVYGFCGYAVVNFIFFMLHSPPSGTSGGPPPSVWRGFSGHWMAFYSAALAIFYAAAVSNKSPETSGRLTPGVR
jgi:hypothetical protein